MIYEFADGHVERTEKPLPDEEVRKLVKLHGQVQVKKKGSI